MATDSRESSERANGLGPLSTALGRLQQSIGDVKACTKAGTGCGGCVPLVQTIFNKQMKAMGTEVSNHRKFSMVISRVAQKPRS